MQKKSYKFRLYPDAEQEEVLKRWAGCVRFVYNYILAMSKENYEKANRRWNTYEYKKLLPQLKEQYLFLKETPSQALQQAIINLGRAYENFFRGRAGFPVFKKKKRAGKIYLSQGFKIEKLNNKWCYLYLPKMKKPLKVRTHRKIEGIISSITIILTSTKKYYVSILVEDSIRPLLEVDRICAIDLGLKDFAVIVYSDGTVERIENPKYLNRTLKRLAKEQRKLLRRQKDSKNREKQRLRVAKLYEKVRSQREDFLHKVSKRIVSENQAIILESLNVKGLLSNSNFSRHISDSSWYKFIKFLTYKAQWYGRQIIFADSFYPSSKLCHICGYKKDDLKLSDRYWICPVCGTEHNRDINASKNLLNYGLARLKGGRAGTVRTYACGGVKTPVKQEATYFNEWQSTKLRR